MYHDKAGRHLQRLDPLPGRIERKRRPSFQPNLFVKDLKLHSGHSHNRQVEPARVTIPIEKPPVTIKIEDERLVDTTSTCKPTTSKTANKKVHFESGDSSDSSETTSSGITQLDCLISDLHTSKYK